MILVHYITAYGWYRYRWRKDKDTWGNLGQVNPSIPSQLKKRKHSSSIGWRKEAILTVQSTNTLVLGLTERGDLIHGLNVLASVQKIALKRQRPEMIACRFKEDINTIKLFFLTGEKIEVDQSVQWRKVTEGFVSYLYPFTVIELTDFEKCLILTQLRVYKKFNTPINLDLDSIVKPIRFYNVFWSIYYGYKTFINWKTLGFRSAPDFGKKKFNLHKCKIKTHSEIFSPGIQTGIVYSAGGPYGTSLQSKIMDILIISQFPLMIKHCDNFTKYFHERIGWLWPNIHGSITRPSGLLNYFGKEKINSLIQIIKESGKENQSLRKKINNPYLGKLAYFPDGAGKLRIIAIGNMIIQITLFPLHDWIFKYLRTLRDQDATFNQDIIFEKFKKYRDQRITRFCKANNLPDPLPWDFDFETWLSKNEVKYSTFKAPYSLDLSRATDRIPLAYQLFVLWAFTQHFGLAVSWFNIISSLSFNIQTPDRKRTLRVTYATGQGMGLYSSWAILALTHHAVVRLSASIIGLHKFSDYLILGDDIVIIREEVSAQYIKIMTRLGVKISLNKTVKPCIGWGAEFASKLVYENELGIVVNITPLPLGPILEGGTSSLFKMYQRLLSLALSTMEEPYQVTSLLDKLPGKLKKFNSQRSSLSSMWAISFLYQNWYTKEWSQGGSIVSPPKGVRLDLVTQWLLENYLIAIPLKVFMEIDLLIKCKLSKQIYKASQNVFKYSDRYIPLQEHILRAFKHVKVRENLADWPELYLFLSSPVYAACTILEETVKYSSVIDFRRENGRINFLEVFLSQRNLLGTIRNLLDHTEFIDMYVNILTISWGPRRYFHQKVKSMDPLVLRVRKSKRNTVLKNIIIFKAVTTCIPKLK
uniref:RNA-dependent RNA polymerase n=1 Tax=Soybean thrips mito-like virus 2 TaxID=2805488 RepID=A0A7T8G212_9VIRU|nr:RNA-dependent RNA polymerase [Soybean thrips mito-like virus 2]